MKNMKDNFTFGDQFINDKSTKEDPGKTNMKTKVESMVTVPIHQASSPVPPLSTPVIDLTPPKPVSPTVQEPAFTATTTTTSTTFPPPPPPQQQSTIDSTLVARVTALEQICENFEKKNKVQDQTAQALSSNENVKEAVQDALKDLVRESFRELLEFEMKEILPLEESMELENREEFMDATTKSRKGRRDDQDPTPPPPKGLDQSKKTRHDSDAFGSKQTPAQTSSSWKSSDIRDTPSSSSKQKPDSQSEQPTNDISIPDDMHLSDTKDIGDDHLPKIKTKTDWLKPILKEETPETPELDWVIPSNDLPEPENNWAEAIAKSYQDPKENKLLQKTRDMGSFIKWYYKRIGKSKLTKADLEGPAFKLVKPFHKNNISLQFQMDECHLLLTNKIDLTNPEGNQVMPDVSKPLPLGGPPGQVIIQPQHFFNKDLEYLISGDKDRRHALLISKLKATYY
ncbi:hypothetical protein Tco_1455685 [Tanacetum coccineum]